MYLGVLCDGVLCADPQPRQTQCMKRIRPIPDTHPQFSVLDLPGYREYRVENWHLARDGSGRIIRGTSYFLWWSILSLCISIAWLKTTAWLLATSLLAITLVGINSLPILYESVVVIPSQGIQFETHQGLTSRPLISSRRFIPFASLKDVVINEALHRWNVRFYLVAIRQVGVHGHRLEVAYENLLPHHPILRQVYHGIQELSPYVAR